MDRMSALDSSFLRVETPTAHMHVGWVSMLERPPGMARLDAARVRERIAARLPVVPRFRQRVVPVPLGLGEPVWGDDPDFELEAHVAEASYDGELDGRDLSALADDFLSRPLARERPLWEILVVPRVTGGRAALVGKVHHAMVDGLAAVELGMLLFDVEPEPDDDAAAAPPWTPSPSPGPIRLAVDSLADSALEQFRQAGRLVAAGRSPGRSVRIADTMRRAAMSLVDDALRPAPASHLNVPIGPRRTLVTHAVDLERLLTIKRTCGVSLNDVVLALCSGALRRFAEASGEPCADVRAMVPISVRDGAAGPGNRITFGFIALPVAEPSAGRRLTAASARMAELKESGRIGGSALLLQGVGALPEPLKTRAARLAASPRLYNVTISNVPGPRMPLYAAGARVHSIAPVIPLPDEHALAIGVLTYDGRAHFAVHADPDALRRVASFPGLLDEALVELELETVSRGGPARRSSRLAPGAAPRARGSSRAGGGRVRVSSR